MYEDEDVSVEDEDVSVFAALLVALEGEDVSVTYIRSCYFGV